MGILERQILLNRSFLRLSLQKRKTMESSCKTQKQINVRNDCRRQTAGAGAETETQNKNKKEAPFTPGSFTAAVATEEIKDSTPQASVAFSSTDEAPGKKIKSK